MASPKYPDEPGLPEDDLQRAEVLVRAARDLIEEDGLDGLTIRAVLSRTGLARRAFYHCFEGKDDLVLAVFNTSLKDSAQHYEAIVARAQGPVEALHEIIRGVVEQQLGQGRNGARRRGVAFSREHLRLAQTRPEDLNTALEPLLDVIVQTIADGMAQGLLRDADPRVQARLIYNLVSTTIHTAMLSEGEGAPLDRTACDAMAAQLWDFCRRAIIA